MYTCTYLLTPWHYSCSTHCEVTLLWGVLNDGNNQFLVVSEAEIHTQGLRCWNRTSVYSENVSGNHWEIIFYIVMTSF